MIQAKLFVPLRKRVIALVWGSTTMMTGVAQLCFLCNCLLLITNILSLVKLSSNSLLSSFALLGLPLHFSALARILLSQFSSNPPLISNYLVTFDIWLGSSSSTSFRWFRNLLGLASISLGQFSQNPLLPLM